MTRVSVISVFHNREQWTQRTVESLLAQDHDDLEIILVDDGSTDGTLRALQEAAAGRARIETHPNMGFVGALKRAISLSSGEYVALLGSGDTCHPGRLSRQAAVLDRRPEIGVVSCGTENIDAASRRVVSQKLSRIDGDASRYMLRRNPFHHGEIMFRRGLYDSVGGYRDFFTYAQDRDLLCRLSMHTHFHTIEETLYSRYVRLPGSVLATPEKLLAQRCLSDFAVYCHEQRLSGFPDPLDLHGPMAGLLKPPSKRLSKDIRAIGLGALRRGRAQTAFRFLQFAHRQHAHPGSLAGLLAARLLGGATQPAPSSSVVLDPRPRTATDRPTIAAVVPVHNKAAYVARALRSAIEQSDRVDEIIVVDDASTDASMSIVRRIAEDHPDCNIVTLRRETPGPGGYAARNRAILSARSDWIAFLDADDEWRPHYVRTLRTLIAAAPPGIGAAFASRRVVRSDGSSFVQTAADDAQADPLIFDFDGFLSLWRKLKRCPIWTSAAMFRRDALLEAGLFPAGRCMRGGDKDTWLRAMAKTRAIASPFVGAIYHLDVADQVTRAVSVCQRHCLCDTLIPLIEESSGRRRKTLKWIFNSEMQKYARWLFGKGRLSPEVYRGFYVESDPILYLMLRAISLTPVSLQRALRHVMRVRLRQTSPVTMSSANRLM